MIAPLVRHRAEFDPCGAAAGLVIRTAHQDGDRRTSNQRGVIEVLGRQRRSFYESGSARQPHARNRGKLDMIAVTVGRPQGDASSNLGRARNFVPKEGQDAAARDNRVRDRLREIGIERRPGRRVATAVPMAGEGPTGVFNLAPRWGQDAAAWRARMTLNGHAIVCEWTGCSK